jgi:hypothetical protein
MLKLVLVFEASDSGYSASATIVSFTAAVETCEKWCEKLDVEFEGLQDYEIVDDSGFAYGFKVTDSFKGAEVSAGQWR